MLQSKKFLKICTGGEGARFMNVSMLRTKDANESRAPVNLHFPHYLRFVFTTIIFLIIAVGFLGNALLLATYLK